MTKYKKNDEYVTIINNILENEEFQKLAKIKHHNTNRLDHSLKVSYYAYKISKKLHLDYISVARAGLLHDFYEEEISDCALFKEKVLLFSKEHPQIAVKNAAKYFVLSEKEKDIIKSHMFPLSNKIPKYKESWLVSAVDKTVSTQEFSSKFKNEISYAVNLFTLFVLNNLLK